MEEVKKERSGAVARVLGVIKTEPMTIQSIKAQLPDLTDGQISMALVYLRDKRKLIDAQKVPRSAKVGRKEVNAYVLRSAA